MHLAFRNCNDAFRRLVNGIHTKVYPTFRTPSRVGDCIQITEPMTIGYANPRERVLFNQARDANPFFHLMEALWMLAGRNDVAPMAYYSSKIADIASDDGKTFNGAYGYRWRHATQIIPYEDSRQHSFNNRFDQLFIIIDELKSNPTSRRVVLQMWNVNDDLLRIGETKDVCCNTAAYFLVHNGRLNMTVTNRSNDLVLGMLGANVVHFSILQEYLAAHIGVGVGTYWQFTNNLHVYVSNWKPEEWLGDTTADFYRLWEGERAKGPFPLVSDPVQFDIELKRFNEEVLGLPEPSLGKEYKESFFASVALPMARAFKFYKDRDFGHALAYADLIAAEDWRWVCIRWLSKRREAARKRETSVERD